MTTATWYLGAYVIGFYVAWLALAEVRWEGVMARPTAGWAVALRVLLALTLAAGAREAVMAVLTMARVIWAAVAGA